MLILSRKKDEGIVLGDNIRVYVLGIEDGKVKLGIDAPKTVPVMRSEVYEKIEASNKVALMSTTSVNNLMTKLKKK